MSLRERVLIAIGVVAVAGTVIIPVAYRLNTEVLGAGAVDTAPIEPTPPVLATPVSAPPSTATPSIASPSNDRDIVIAWAREASEHRLETGATFDYDCPPNGPFRFVWGTSIYTDDSSVCTAAIHDGVITLDVGGTVTIVMRPGRSSYRGSIANGVESESYEEWQGSYEFVVP